MLGEHLSSSLSVMSAGHVATMNKQGLPASKKGRVGGKAAGIDVCRGAWKFLCVGNWAKALCVDSLGILTPLRKPGLREARGGGGRFWLGLRSV